MPTRPPPPKTLPSSSLACITPTTARSRPPQGVGGGERGGAHTLPPICQRGSKVSGVGGDGRSWWPGTMVMTTSLVCWLGVRAAPD